jgi:flagellar basal-body rod protein FlgC
MDPIFSIALSGLNAATLRLQVSASNVANADSAGALPDPATGNPGTPAPFQPLQVTQQPLLSGGTSAATVPLTPAFTPSFSPDSPFANSEGLVAAPNVDLVSERLDQLAAANAYRANLRVLQVADELDKETIDSVGRPSTDLSA